MRNKMYWGLGVLVILLCTAFVFMTIRNRAEIQQLETELVDANKLEQDLTQPVAENKPPREPKDGHQWEWHGDHWHEMPVAQVVALTPIEQPVPMKQVQTYTGPLTYHEELLKTNPVKALRLQAEERGHPCAEWVPPFPPDDTEAQTFARNAYLSIYLDEGNPEREKAGTAFLEKLDAISYAMHEEGQHSERNYDLMKISWVVGSIPQSHYNGNTALFPSDYFSPIRD